MNWDQYFFEIAQVTCKKSKDTSTKVGAVIVGPNKEVRSLGFNGMPRGVNDDVEIRHQRPTKYYYFEHAERNAIYNAARNGIVTDNCELYLYPMVPCTDCARAIIQSGIKVVKVYVTKESPNYAETNKIANEMLVEAGVKLLIYNHSDYNWLEIK